MNHRQGSDDRIQNRPPPPRLPAEDVGAPPVDIADIGRALWKLAQVGMGAFGGALTGLFLGGFFVAVIGSLLGDLALSVLQYGGLESLIGGVVGGLACGIVVWKDLSHCTSRH